MKTLDLSVKTMQWKGVFWWYM